MKTDTAKMLFSFIYSFSILPCQAANVCMSSSATLDAKVDRVLKFACKQLTKTIMDMKGDNYRFPVKAVLGKDTTWRSSTSEQWTSGYFPGLLWYIYEITGDDFWKENAQSWTLAVEEQKDNISQHDIGLMIGCSFGNGYRLTKNEHYREVLLEAAKSLATRYNPVVGCIRSWGSNSDKNNFLVIIDGMVCTELLFIGAKIGGKRGWHNIAVSHAIKTIENHIRPDASTYHVVNYDPISGAVLGKNSNQGYALESCWSRGQAWALHGFTTTARETGDERFLQAAQRVADYFINHLPEDYVAYWDFEAPNIPSEKRDTSAASIAASGLFELCTLVKDDNVRRKYFDVACKILISLCSPPYLAEGTDSPAILLQMVGSRYDARQPEIISYFFGDYYFIEAIVRYKKITGAL